jgi:hypothetical protein
LVDGRKFQISRTRLVGPYPWIQQKPVFAARRTQAAGKKPGFADSACVVGFSRAAATACALFLYQSRKHRVKHSRAFSFFREFS